MYSTGFDDLSTTIPDDGFRDQKNKRAQEDENDRQGVSKCERQDELRHSCYYLQNASYLPASFYSHTQSRSLNFSIFILLSPRSF
jgi:hypothetical protein